MKFKSHDDTKVLDDPTKISHFVITRLLFAQFTIALTQLS